MYRFYSGKMSLFTQRHLYYPHHIFYVHITYIKPLTNLKICNVTRAILQKAIAVVYRTACLTSSRTGRTVSLSFVSAIYPKTTGAPDRASVKRCTWFQWCRPAVVWPRVTSPKATCLRGRVQKRRAFRFVRPDPNLTNRVCVWSQLRLIGETSLHIKMKCKLPKHVDTRIGFIPTGGQNVNSTVCVCARARVFTITNVFRRF